MPNLSFCPACSYRLSSKQTGSSKGLVDYFYCPRDNSLYVGSGQVIWFSQNYVEELNKLVSQGQMPQKDKQEALAILELQSQSSWTSTYRLGLEFARCPICRRSAVIPPTNQPASHPTHSSDSSGVSLRSIIRTVGSILMDSPQVLATIFLLVLLGSVLPYIPLVQGLFLLVLGDGLTPLSFVQDNALALVVGFFLDSLVLVLVLNWSSDVFNQLQKLSSNLATEVGEVPAMVVLGQVLLFFFAEATLGFLSFGLLSLASEMSDPTLTTLLQALLSLSIVALLILVRSIIAFVPISFLLPEDGWHQKTRTGLFLVARHYPFMLGLFGFYTLGQVITAALPLVSLWNLDFTFLQLVFSGVTLVVLGLVLTSLFWRSYQLLHAQVEESPVEGLL